MEKLELKEIIIRHARIAYEGTLERQRETQQGIATDAMDAENDAMEMGDDSNKLETLDDVELLAEITDAQQDSLGALEQLIAARHWEVMVGSVIVTDHRNFLVAATVPSFEVFGVEYTGISPEAPIFKALEGKQAGDKVTFRDITYEIKDIF